MFGGITFGIVCLYQNFVKFNHFLLHLLNSFSFFFCLFDPLNTSISAPPFRYFKLNILFAIDFIVLTQPLNIRAMRWSTYLLWTRDLIQWRDTSDKEALTLGRVNKAIHSNHYLITVMSLTLEPLPRVMRQLTLSSWGQETHEVSRKVTQNNATSLCSFHFSTAPSIAALCIFFFFLLMSCHVFSSALDSVRTLHFS